jgi:transcriptional regulator with XRE-family HTH domain
MDHERSLGEELRSTREGLIRSATEHAVVHVSKQIEELMEAKDVSRADLAKLLNCSNSWVTQLLDGENNKTIRTVAHVYALLDAQFEPTHTPLVASGESENCIAKFEFDLHDSAPTWITSADWRWDLDRHIKHVRQQFSEKIFAGMSDGT